MQAAHLIVLFGLFFEGVHVAVDVFIIELGVNIHVRQLIYLFVGETLLKYFKKFLRVASDLSEVCFIFVGLEQLLFLLLGLDGPLLWVPQSLKSAVII